LYSAMRRPWLSEIEWIATCVGKVSVRIVNQNHVGSRIVR
jgi:hypothetical protein